MNDRSISIALKRAIEEADKAVARGDGGPFGAAIVKEGKVIAKAHNTVIKDSDPTAHAEVNAIRAAGRKLKSHDLSGCVLAASSEPCPMCLAAAYWAGIAEVHFVLPTAAAAAAGFRDSDLFGELSKPAGRRKLASFRHPEMADGAEVAFRKWKESEGETY